MGDGEDGGHRAEPHGAAIPLLPTGLVPASGTGQHVATGRRKGVRSRRPYTAANASLGGGMSRGGSLRPNSAVNLPPALSSPLTMCSSPSRDDLSQASNHELPPAGSEKDLLQRRQSTAPWVDPSHFTDPDRGRRTASIYISPSPKLSAAPTGASLSPQRRLFPMAFIDWQREQVATLETTGVQKMAEASIAQLVRWDEQREAYRVAQREELRSRKAKEAKLRAQRMRKEEQKAVLREERDEFFMLESVARKGVAKDAAAEARALIKARWRGALDITTKQLIRDTMAHEVYERCELMKKELHSREVPTRRFLGRVCHYEGSLVMDMERGIRRVLQQKVEEVRRFRAEQENQRNKLLGTEMHEREVVVNEELWLWMQLEKEHVDWKFDLAERTRQAEELRRKQHREYLEECQRQRLVVINLESAARPELRIEEAGARLDLVSTEQAERDTAKRLEQQRIEEEMAELEKKHAEERKPLLDEEQASRLDIVAGAHRGIDLLRDRYERGRKEILKPVNFRLPQTEVIHIADSNPLLVAHNGIIDMKKRYNPYANSSVVHLTIDIGVVEGFTPGDSLSVLTALPNTVRGGYTMLRFSGRFESVYPVARIMAQTDRDGPFPEPNVIGCRPLGHKDWEVRDDPEEDGVSQDPKANVVADDVAAQGEADGGNRWLRVRVCLSRGRDPFADAQFVLQHITLSIVRPTAWKEGDDLGPKRVIAARIILGLTPNPADVAKGLRLVACCSHQMLTVVPQPPLIFIPLSNRHVGYELGKDRIRDGARTAMRIMPSLQAMHPERDASGSTLTVSISPHTVSQGDRLTIRGHGVEIKVRGTTRASRYMVSSLGHDIAEVIEGVPSASGGDPCTSLKLRFGHNIPQWKVVEVLRAFRYSTQAQQPYRPRRKVVATLSEAPMANGLVVCSSTVTCCVNLVFSDEHPPTFAVLSHGVSQCVVWRPSVLDVPKQHKQYIDSAIVQICPDAIVENQHAYGVPGVGPGLLRGGELRFRVEQGAQQGDLICVRCPPTESSKTLKMAGVCVDTTQRTVTINERMFARWTDEAGGTRSTGVYEGATSAAWLKVDITADEYTEEELCSLLRCISFTNISPTPFNGVRWIAAVVAIPDPLAPNAPPSKARIGVRGCLPIFSIPPRFQSQKYVENEGRRKLALFDIPEPVFRDDDLVAVFDGGFIRVELVSGGEDADTLGLNDSLSKEYELSPVREGSLVRVLACGSSQQIGLISLQKCGTQPFTIRLGTQADRRRTVDISQKRPHASGVRKKELLALLRNLYYLNESDDPVCLSKTIRITVEDSFGARSQGVIELHIQPINDHTTVTVPSTTLNYRQGSRAAYLGFQLVKGVQLHDPDTSEIRGGFVSVELSTGGGKHDRLGIMTPEQQASMHAKSRTPHEKRVAVTLAQNPDGPNPLVLLGGLVVGTFEFRAVKKGAFQGQVLRFNIALPEPWPGWEGLPSHPLHQHSNRQSSMCSDADTPRSSNAPKGKEEHRVSMDHSHSAVSSEVTDAPTQAKRGSITETTTPSLQGGRKISKAAFRAQLPLSPPGTSLDRPPMGLWPRTTAPRRVTKAKKGPEAITLPSDPLPPPTRRRSRSLVGSGPLIDLVGSPTETPPPPEAVQSPQLSSPQATNAAGLKSDHKRNSGRSPRASLAAQANPPTSSSRKKLRESKTEPSPPPRCASYGLPLEAVSHLLDCIVYCNTATGPAMKVGQRTYLLKVNAGDDVGDTKVKVHVIVNPPVASLPAAIPTALKYLEGSDYIPLCPKINMGLPPRTPVRRGWLQFEIVQGFVRGEDQLGIHDPSGDCIVLWDVPAPPAAPTPPLSTATDTRRGSRITLSRSEWGAVLFEQRLEKKISGNIAPNDTWGGATLIGRVHASDTTVVVYFDSYCVATVKHLTHLFKCLCYRNVSQSPDLRTRVIQIQYLYGEDTLPEPLTPHVDIDTEGYLHSSMELTLEVEAVDNPTEVWLPTTQLFFPAGAGGVAAAPLSVALGAEATDPDTPFFDPPAELSVEVLGGSKNDVLDLAPHPPLGEIDNIQIQEGGLFLHQSRVASFQRGGTCPSSKISILLEHCPVEAIALIMRRVVYRFLSVPKRIMKKTIQFTVKPAAQDARTAPPTRVKIAVNVVQAPLEYTTPSTAMVQVGRKPVPLMPPSLRVVIPMTNTEVKFELVKPLPSPPPSPHLCADESVVPRHFWYPFEGLSWLSVLRPPLPHDALRFDTNLLGGEYSVKALDASTLEVHSKEGKVCTVHTPEKELQRQGDTHTVHHEVVLTFTSRVANASARLVTPVLKAVQYEQDVDEGEDLTVLSSSLSGASDSERTAIGIAAVQSAKSISGLLRRRQSLASKKVLRKRHVRQSVEDIPSETAPDVVVKLSTKIPAVGSPEPLRMVDYFKVKPRERPA